LKDLKPSKPNSSTDSTTYSKASLFNEANLLNDSSSSSASSSASSTASSSASSAGSSAPSGGGAPGGGGNDNLAAIMLQVGRMIVSAINDKGSNVFGATSMNSGYYQGTA
jgi:hypothetical protein